MRTLVALFFVLLSYALVSAQNTSLEAFPVDEAWTTKIFNLAPEKPTAPVSKTHNVLLFSLHTGFEHWVIPHANAVVTILGEKSGAYDVVASKDVFMFEKERLQEFDAIVLNNNCSISPKRDLFFDALSSDSTLTEDYIVQKAAELEDNLLDYVRNGGGLAVIHGAIVMQNNSKEVSEMIGGSFDYHPRQQTIALQLADKKHPLTAAFKSGSFTHYDEPYFFKNAYARKNFKPLLYMEMDKIQEVKHETEDQVSYVSWIKTYGNGRVFYCSPSHNAQSYESSELLAYYLNGMQYVLGDLQCDDSTVKP